MVTNRIQLTAENSILRLNTDSDNWCEVTLQSGNQYYQLGAEDKTKIIERLQNSLCNNELEFSGKIDGISVCWVVSLAERHTSVYVGVENNVRYFFFQNEAGDIFAKLNLKSEIRKKWLQLLAS